MLLRQIYGWINFGKKVANSATIPFFCLRRCSRGNSMKKINQPPETLRDLKPDSKLICTGSGALPSCAAKMFRELTQVSLFAGKHQKP